MQKRQTCGRRTELVNKVISSTSHPPSVAAATATATVEAIQQDIEINKIYNEDCIVGMRRIKADSADIVICDPPYNIGKDFRTTAISKK
jgi:tRNA1(Val) A37 N6-methylase TrmN6